METAIWQEGEGPDARCGRLYTYHIGSIATIRVTFGLQGAPSIVEVAWHDGRTARWSIQKPEISVYQDQFGLSVSKDGRFLFVQTWETGLHCLNAATGEPVWHSPSKRGVTSLAVNNTTLVAHQRAHALLLMDIETGAVLREKRPARAWDFYQLTETHFICQTTARQWEIIRTEDLETVQTIPHKLFPRTSGDGCWCIRDVWLEDGQLWCNAFRSAANGDSPDDVMDAVIPVELAL